MAEFTKPSSDRLRVKRAGQAIANGLASKLDEAVAREWRDAHIYVLNAFQGTLRRWIRSDETVLVQRLKRMNTIRDKLSTRRFGDLSKMHDLAGCRLIFPDYADLATYREAFLSRTRSAHRRINGEKYNYISQPKSDGYRGIHDVFEYAVDTESVGSAWNGLKVEVQYRTQAQHAWATAVEISDIIDCARVKFEKGASPEREEFFRFASEWIARNAEGMRGPIPDIDNESLRKKLRLLDNRLGILNRLRALDASKVEVPNSRNIVLVFSDQLEIKGFRSSRIATEYRNKIEISNPDYDSVYVRANKPSELANAFRNYFRDSAAFLRYMSEI